jgi:hypothetical protein
VNVALQVRGPPSHTYMLAFVPVQLPVQPVKV